MAAYEPLLGQAPTDDVNMTDAQSDQPTQQQHLTSHHHIPDRPPHPVSPVPIPQIPGRPSPTGAHPTANQGPSAIRSTTAPTTNGSTTEDQQSQPPPPYQQRASSSRAASAHPQDTASGQGQGQQQQGPGLMGTAGMPTEPTLHGAPVRQYLNTKVTGHLLEGMKMLAKEQPKDPLRALGEFLLQRSKQYEGGGGANGSSTSA